jgi:hypothetical protein
MGNRKLKILCSVDDAVLQADNEDDLQRLLYRFKTTSEEYNVKLSIE